MIPKIIVSRHKREVNKYLNKFIKDEGFDKYYIYKIIPEKTKISINQIKNIQNQIITQSEKKRLFIVEFFDTATI